MLASLIKGDFRVGLLLLQLLLQFTVTEVAVIGAGAGSPRRRPRRKVLIIVQKRGITRQTRDGDALGNAERSRASPLHGIDGGIGDVERRGRLMRRAEGGETNIVASKGVKGRERARESVKERECVKGHERAREGVKGRERA